MNSRAELVRLEYRPPYDWPRMLRFLGRVTAGRAAELSQPWRPWRSYATLHLWLEAGEEQSTIAPSEGDSP